MPLRLVREASGFDLHVVATEDEARTGAMTLRTKLLLAQAPLAVALALVGLRRRARSPPRLGDQLAADPGRQLPQRPGRAAHEGGARADRQRALYVLAGHTVDAAPRSPGTDEVLRARARGRRRATSPSRGRREATARCAQRWERHTGAALDGYLALTARGARAEAYFAAISQPRFIADQARTRTTILALNQDAMVRKSERAAATGAQQFEQLVIGWWSWRCAGRRCSPRSG